MGQTKTYDLSGLDSGLVDHIRQTLGHGRKTITRVEISDTGKTLCVDVEDAESLAYVDSFVGNIIATSRKLRAKVLYQNSAAQRFAGDIDVELRSSGELFELGPGLVGLRGSVLKLFQFFEAEFVAIAQLFKAEENRYPAMLPLEIIEELKYFTHFPQQVTFCSHFPEDLGVLESVSRSASERSGDLVARDLEILETPRHALQPAVCLPCYRQHRGRVFEAAGNFAVSMQNHVYRYEGNNFHSLSRIWEFTVRDIVFFGSGPALVEKREHAMERAFALCVELDLDASIELANDPFFLDAARDKRIYQRMGEVKFELLLELSDRQPPLAAASFNLHRDFYTDVYDIRIDSGELAESACMGFGIERWLYAFLSQKGLHPSGWPRRVREFVENA